MNILQEKVLNKLISIVKETGKNSIDTTLFSQLENQALHELENMGYIVSEDKIIGTYRLTERALSK